MARLLVELPSNLTVSMTEGEVVSQYEISFLPPLLLTFELPADYPSSSPPSFNLACSWLTHPQLSALGSHLIDLYQATGGTVILFSWVQFLKEDALKFLDIHTLLDLSSDEYKTPQFSQDSPNTKARHTLGIRVSSDVTDLSSSSAKDQTSQGAAALPVHGKESTGLVLSPSQTVLSQLLIHDAEQKQKAFNTTVFDCGVCFVGWPGSECVQLPECGHVFCQACLSEFCRLRITEGNVHAVTCLQTDCRTIPTPAQVRDLVGDELFRRYDRLLLQSSLDLMSDVTYCPRKTCGSPVIVEKSSNAALCSVCNFAFCVTCKKTYHGTNDCQTKTNVKNQIQEDPQQGTVDLPQSQEGMKSLMEDYLGGSKERQRLLLSRYGYQSFKVILPDYLSEDWITVECKHCPHCFCKIQKNGGCNIMTCSRCRQRFCWLCLKRLSFPVDNGHFEIGTCTQYSY
uniref:RBR-type E3 ubiquitin transferase n=1 Tax=Cynoglossus semilaevis TaxID=244447 RepID=A0A3P8WUG6_CYNSE